MKRSSKEKLPFSFKKKAVSAEKISGHWQKIVEQIAEQRNAVETDTKKTSEINSIKRNNSR